MFLEMKPVMVGSGKGLNESDKKMLQELVSQSSLYKYD
jgi:hypothetical protein